MGAGDELTRDLYGLIGIWSAAQPYNDLAGHVDESNPQAVRRFLEQLVQRLGVRVIVTDDLVSFRKVAEKPGLEHQLCQFHVRRWVGRSLRELSQTVPKKWLWVLDREYITRRNYSMNKMTSIRYM